MQAFAFRAQIKLAMKLDMPLVLHVRDDDSKTGMAMEDCHRILVECGVPKDFRIHMHCFNGNGFKISVE